MLGISTLFSLYLSSELPAAMETCAQGPASIILFSSLIFISFLNSPPAIDFNIVLWIHSFTFLFSESPWDLDIHSFQVLGSFETWSLIIVICLGLRFLYD